MKILTAPFYGICEFKPANGRECLCILKDGRVKTAYYDHGFWDSWREDSIEIGREVEYWAYSDTIKIN